MKLRFTKLELNEGSLVVNFGTNIKTFQPEEFDNIRENGIPFTDDDLLNGDVSKIQIKAKVNNIIQVKKFKEGIETAIELGSTEISSPLKVGESNFIQVNADGKLPVDCLPTESLIYKGLWDATTNAYPNNGSRVGEFYIVSKEATVDSTKFYLNDWIIWNGNSWDRSANANAVASVNGKVGAVELNATDVGALPSSYTSPVESVNNKTGEVVLTASDISNAVTTNTKQTITGDKTFNWTDTTFGSRTGNDMLGYPNGGGQINFGGKAISFIYAKRDVSSSDDIKTDSAGWFYQGANSNGTIYHPKKSGTIALTSDIPSTSNFVQTSNNQTISGTKTFTGEVVLPTTEGTTVGAIWISNGDE